MNYYQAPSPTGLCIHLAATIALGPAEGCGHITARAMMTCAPNRIKMAQTDHGEEAKEVKIVSLRLIF